MKRFPLLFAILMAFSFALNPVTAEAKKFGGGKSFGKSFKTAPAPKKTDNSTFNANKQQNTTPANNEATKNAAAKKGMLGGLLGGLLAGGLFAALLGGAFQGLQIIDVLIFGVLAFALFTLFKRMNRAKAMAMAMAAGHGGAGDGRVNGTGHFASHQNEVQPRYIEDLFGQSHRAEQMKEPHPQLERNSIDAHDVPMNLPDAFNMNAFINGARDHYRTLQEAWNKNDLETMREYLSPDLFEHMKAARHALPGYQHTEVMFVDAELGRADYNDHLAEISVCFSGKYRDTVEGIEETITDVWHLEKTLTEPNASWLIVGIEN